MTATIPTTSFRKRFRFIHFLYLSTKDRNKKIYKEACLYSYFLPFSPFVFLLGHSFFFFFNFLLEILLYTSHHLYYCHGHDEDDDDKVSFPFFFNGVLGRSCSYFTTSI
jgi:hypothetical protein